MVAYRKLPHGPWGVITDDPSVAEGDPITVTTKSGKDKAETLAKHLYSAGRYHVFALVDRRADMAA